MCLNPVISRTVFSKRRQEALPAFIAAAPGFESLRGDSTGRANPSVEYSSTITPEGFQPCSVFAHGQVVCLTWEHDQYDYSSLVRAVSEIVGKAPDRVDERAKTAVWYLDRVRIEINEIAFVILSVSGTAGR